MWEWCMDTDNSPWLYMHNYCFAPAVNPPVERCKQKKAGGFCVEKKKWLVGERVWEWHKVKAIVDFICGSIQITRIENPFVTERFMEIMHAAAAADVHGRPQCRRNFKEGGEGFPLIQNFRALALEPRLPERPGDTLLIVTIFQGQELKALWGALNDLPQTVMLLAMALRGPDARVSAWLVALDKSFWQLQNNANGRSLVATKV